MKLVFNRSSIGRHAATGTVLALAAATLSLAGPASADPTITDLKGTVTGVGSAAVGGIDVRVFNAATNDLLGDQVTAPDGTYKFVDLDFDGDVVRPLDALAGWEMRRRLHEMGGPPVK